MSATTDSPCIKADDQPSLPKPTGPEPGEGKIDDATLDRISGGGHGTLDVYSHTNPPPRS